jgi:hypothetical protein
MDPYSGGSAFAEPANGPSFQALFEPLSMPTESPQVDDSEEWEYEYSTTETEVSMLVFRYCNGHQ